MCQCDDQNSDALTDTATYMSYTDLCAWPLWGHKATAVAATFLRHKQRYPDIMLSG